MKRYLSLALIAIAFPANAHAGQRTDAELQHLARATTHGWTQDTQSIPLLERRYLAGERLYITCGTISRLAVTRLHQIGVKARVVGTVTLDTPNRVNDGHILIEVDNGGRWEVYDLDNNRKPVDAQGRGVTIKQFVAMRHRHWILLAHDRPIRYTGTNLRARFGGIYTSEATLSRWYDHVLGVAVMFANPDGTGMATMSETNPWVIHRALRVGGYINVPAAQWMARYR